MWWCCARAGLVSVLPAAYLAASLFLFLSRRGTRIVVRCAFCATHTHTRTLVEEYIGMIEEEVELFSGSSFFVLVSLRLSANMRDGAFRTTVECCVSGGGGGDSSTSEGAIRADVVTEEMND